jgi:hypothetical protein
MFVCYLIRSLYAHTLPQYATAFVNSRYHMRWRIRICRGCPVASRPRATTFAYATSWRIRCRMLAASLVLEQLLPVSLSLSLSMSVSVNVNVNVKYLVSVFLSVSVSVSVSSVSVSVGVSVGGYGCGYGCGCGCRE